MTLVARTPTRDVRAGLAPTAHLEVGVTCHCGDPSVDRLRDLIAQGVPQFEASRLLWGPPPPDPDPPFETRSVPLFRWIGLRDRSC